MQLTPYGKVGNLELQWIVVIYIPEQKYCEMLVAIMMLTELGNHDSNLISSSNIQVLVQITNAFRSAHDLVYFMPTNFHHFRV
jgi:hypothetical protein